MESVDRIGDPEISELVRAFIRLERSNVRRTVIRLMSAMATADAEEAAAALEVNSARVDDSGA